MNFIRKFTNSIYLLFLIVFLSTLHAQDISDLSQKVALNGTYPMYFSFRGEMYLPNHTNYTTWKNGMLPYDGVIKKFIDEELAINLNTPLWVNQYAQEAPIKLNLLHFNGQNRQVIPTITQKGELMDRKYVHDLYFPGHWVYKVGNELRQNCSIIDTVIKVASVNVFAEVDTAYPNVALLVKLDATGNRLWYESEMISINKKNVGSNTLDIKRGLFFTTPKNFIAEQTMVLPIDCDISAAMPLFWFYNMSADCPKDKNGRTAADVLVIELKSYFSTTGKLKNMNGIAFDVNYFNYPNKSGWDVNNDNIADGGWINNENRWMKGDYAFLKQLRENLPQNLIITADGQIADNQQAVNVINGIESEGLVQHNDGWRGISRTLNTHLYWQSNSSVANPFRYIVLKLMNATDIINEERLRRFAIATACCLEAKLGVILSDLINLPTWVQQSGSLGKPIGGLIRYAKQSPNLQTLSNNNLIAKLSSDNCTFALVNGNIEITSRSGYAANDDMTFTFSNITMPTGDITVFIETQSIDPLEGMTLSDKVPRNFYCSLTNLPDYGEGRNTNALYADLYGKFGTSKVEELSFYYRRQGVITGNQTLSFKVQGRGKFLIKSIKMYNAPDIFLRQFENGIVVVNPSLNNNTVYLSQIFPTKNFVENQIAIPAVDASFIQVKATRNNSIKDNILISKVSHNTYRINNNENRKFEIRLFNNCGQRVLSNSFSNMLFSLPERGIYHLQIMEKGELLWTEKMIF